MKVDRQLTQDFRISEFFVSETAEENGWPEDLDWTLVHPEVVDNVERLAKVLQKVRDWFSESIAQQDAPMLITSCYRSQRVNAAIGGSPRSDHLTGASADWHCPTVGDNYQCAYQLEHNVDYFSIGQLILEDNGIVHTSLNHPYREINRVITMDWPDGVRRIRPGIHLLDKSG